VAYATACSLGTRWPLNGERGQGHPEVYRRGASGRVVGRDIDRKTEELYAYIRCDDFRRRLSGITGAHVVAAKTLCSMTPDRLDRPERDLLVLFA